MRRRKARKRSWKRKLSCERREEVERAAAQREEELEQQIADIQTAQSTPAIPVAAVSSESAPELAPEAKQAMSEALRIYDVELSPEELQNLERTPDRIVDRLTDALNSVSRALVVQPDLSRRLDVEGEIALGADGV